MRRAAATKCCPFPARQAVLFAVLLAVSSLSAAAQQPDVSLRGTVVAADGTPVAGATVSLAGTNWLVRTSETGSFAFRLLPAGTYDLTVDHPGYEPALVSKLACGPDRPLTLRITILRRINLSDTITATASQSFVSPTGTVITREEIQRSHARTVGELLDQDPLLTTTESSQGTTISLRGSRSDQVLVLIDGQPVNNLTTGAADLSSLDIESVERIEIETAGAGARYGPDAASGAVHIITRRSHDAADSWTPKEITTRSRSGQEKTQDRRVTITGLSLSSWSFDGTWSRQETNGDFAFRYQIDPQPDAFVGVRANNGRSSESLHLSAQSPETSLGSLRLSVWQRRSTFGLPGEAPQPTLTATGSDRQVSANGEWQRQWRSLVATEVRVGIRQSRQQYTDTIDIPAAFDYASSYESEVVSVATRTSIETRQLSLVLLADGNWSSLDHRDEVNPPSTWLGESSRHQFGLGGELTFSDEQNVANLPLQVGLTIRSRWDEIASRGDQTNTSRTRHLTPSVHAFLSTGSRWKAGFRGGYGKSVRLPTLHALFWGGDARAAGNPDLRPERVEQSELTFESSYDFLGISTSATLGYWHANYTDLIVWEPRGPTGVWTPVNLARSQHTGWTETLEIRDQRNRWSIAYYHNRIDAINRTPGPTTFGQRVIFVPRHSQRMTATVDIESVFVRWSSMWVDQRFALANNTKSYAAYRLDDLSVGLRMSWGVTRWEILYDVANLRDAAYVLTAHHPMPPRQWSVGIALTIVPRQ